MTSTRDFYKKLKHFKAREFREWAPFMSYQLLFKLDALRDLRGEAIHISPATGALGRHLGRNNPRSQHNVDYYKVVNAVDVMPDGFVDQADFRKFFFQAKELGFTGIGIYPDWSPRAGAHLDVRTNRQEGDPATWAAFRYNDGPQQYVSIEEAIGPLTNN